MYGETRQDEKRDRMARHALYNALRRVSVPDLTGDYRIVPDNRVVVYADVGL
jgi:hypothetical protein